MEEELAQVEDSEMDEISLNSVVGPANPKALRA